MDLDTAEALGRMMSAASSGAELIVGSSLAQVLDRASASGLQMLVIDEETPMVTAAELLASQFPNAVLVQVADRIEDAMLAVALRFPKVLGFLGRTDAGVRSWELSYLVRRTLAPQQPSPGSHELLNWGASTVAFRPRSTRDRDQTVQAIETVATRFGLQRRAAQAAADAAHELLMNAMYDAPVDAAGRPRYAADRQAQITLQDPEVPTLRMTVDGGHLALDMVDPFGRLPRQKLFGGVLRGRTGQIAQNAQSVLDVSHGGAGLGLFNLVNSAASFRVEVIPGRQTLVSWVQDRNVSTRTQRTQSRSLYYLEARAPTG